MPQLGFRCPPDIAKRLAKAAKFRGQSINKFIETAVVAEIIEVEERRRAKKDADDVASLSPLRQQTNGDAPEGLGIARAQQRRTTEAIIEQHQQQQPAERQVVVNVGNTAASGGDLIDRFASYVASAKDFERDVRLRKAVDILRETAQSDEERKVLAARLDEAIAAKTNSKGNDQNGVVRVARIAFDKIADILR